MPKLDLSKLAILPVSIFRIFTPVVIRFTAPLNVPPLQGMTVIRGVFAGNLAVRRGGSGQPCAASGIDEHDPGFRGGGVMQRDALEVARSVDGSMVSQLK